MAVSRVLVKVSEFQPGFSDGLCAGVWWLPGLRAPVWSLLVMSGLLDFCSMS